MMTRFLVLLVWCGALGVGALEPDDLLFHLSFDGGVVADFARGSAAPAYGEDPLKVFGTTPRPGLPVVATAAAAAPRLVPGLVGQGYRFGGPGSTLAYRAAGGPDRGNALAYGAEHNLLPDRGSVSFWIQHLPNTHNQLHLFFRADTPGGVMQVLRDHYWVYGFTWRQGGGINVPTEGWQHFVMTWQQGEVILYANCEPTKAETPGLQPPKLGDLFYLAAEAMRTAQFCREGWEDDTVMDEFQIFRRALTAAEVRALYERGAIAAPYFGGPPGSGPQKLAPERPFAAAVATAAPPPAAIVVDGDLADWDGIPVHGGWVDTRLGVADAGDPGEVRWAADDTTLYLAYRCPVDSSIQDEGTRVWFPKGEFKADARERDGDVLADDYVEFAVGDCRFAVNAFGALLDRRGGDAAWNTAGTCAAQADNHVWTVELALPLAELGDLSLGVRRSWKLFRAAENSLFTDRQARDGVAAVLRTPATAAIADWGAPGAGKLALQGSVVGPPGDYLVTMQGNDWEERATVAAGDFRLTHEFPEPTDQAAVVTVTGPDDAVLLTRTLPFVYVAASQVDLVDYPGWQKLDVVVTPLPVDREGLSATVAVTNGARHTIADFTEAVRTVRFDTGEWAPGDYQVTVQLLRDGRPTAAIDRAFTKKPLPEWFGNTVGIVDGPPMPWTDVAATTDTIRLLLKKINFADTLFPTAIVSNDEALLAGPMRLRVRRGEVESVVTAGDFRMTGCTRRQASWRASARDGDLEIAVDGTTEFDGFTWIALTLTGGPVDRVAFEVPFCPGAATLKATKGKGVMGSEPVTTAYPGWIGNERAGMQFGWEHRWTWEQPRQECATITPGPDETCLSIAFVDRPTTFAKPRTIEFYWCISPTKPIRADWRHFDRYGLGYWTGDRRYWSTTYAYSGWSYTRPNYPVCVKPDAERAAYREQLWNSFRRQQEDKRLVCWYAYGPYMWVGAPEYADWHHEWHWTGTQKRSPDPHSAGWGPACHNSSASELFVWLLDRYVKEFPLRGLYFDCMPVPNCANEAHGCGYVTADGRRLPVSQVRATRRHFERIYNVIKAAGPEYGWIRHHDWGPTLAIAAFCDENWIGEGLIGPIGAAPEKNYYRVVDLPMARVDFRAPHYGHLTSWLGELACSAGSDPAKRAEWYGKEVVPGTPDKPGVWTLPRWVDYEHEVGLSFVNDTWSIGGNELPLPAMRLAILQRRLDWGPDVQFVGYWEADGWLAMDGAVPEQIVCSAYRQVTAARAWLLLVPMNNTDTDVTVTIRPDFARLGVTPPNGAEFADAYRAVPVRHECQPHANLGAVGTAPGYIEVPAEDIRYPLREGALTVPVPKRNFRALLYESPTPR